MTKRKYDFGVIIAIISLLPILVTFIPLFKWYPGFELFMLLRLVACVTVAYMAWLSYKLRLFEWVWIFTFVAVLLSPFFTEFIFGHSIDNLSFAWHWWVSEGVSPVAIHLETVHVKEYFIFWRYIAASVTGFLILVFVFYEPE